MPSIIYGLLGLGLFVRIMGMNRSVLAGYTEVVGQQADAEEVEEVVTEVVDDLMTRIEGRPAPADVEWIRNGAREAAELLADEESLMIDQEKMEERDGEG